MTIEREWIVLDTNVWIFGLRQEPTRAACFHLLHHLPNLFVRVPRQILLELHANLSQEEMDDFFRLLNRHPEQRKISWDKVEPALIHKYQQLGCKLGDATVAAHLEVLGVKLLVSENRDFLTEIAGLPFRVLSAEAFLEQLDVESSSRR
jgi:predicted nucleic acid-binding protein